jgi:hypothetical protein
MGNNLLEIDQQVLQRLINKKRFDISGYDFFIYIALCFFSVVMFCLILVFIFQNNKSPFVLFSSVVLASIVLISYLFIIVRSFFDTFYFKRIVTNLTAERALPDVLKLLIDRNISGQQSHNAPNVLTCFEYYNTKTLIETTIIIQDNYLLINSRSKNTSKVFLHRTGIIQLIRQYFKR